MGLRAWVDEQLREEQRAQPVSRQPRFTSPENLYSVFTQWAIDADATAPPYSSGIDSMRLDKWLNNWWRRESHIAGALSSITALDKNRGWSIVGGRTAVNRYQRRLLHEVEDGQGWRTWSAKLSQGFWSTNMGAIMEFEMQGRNMRAAWALDPTRCYLTGNPATPLAYRPTGKTEQKWEPQEFERFCSMPNIDEDFRGLGFCALNRALELTRILYAVHQHDMEQLGARAPKGILLLHNVSEDQWKTALSSRKAELDGLGQRYFGGVMTLASAGIDQIDVKLVSLSQLPQNFDQLTFVNLTMYGIALCFGFDPQEIWPVQMAALGRTTEVERSHQKGTAKGGKDYILGHQEAIQKRLQSVAFEYDLRDTASEAVEAERDLHHERIVTELYTAGLQHNAPLLGETVELARQRALALLGQRGIVPRSWSTIDPDVTASDESVSHQRDYWINNRYFARACQEARREPIISFRWHHDAPAEVNLLWDSGDDVFRCHNWRGVAYDVRTTWSEVGASLLQIEKEWRDNRMTSMMASRRLARGFQQAFALLGETQDISGPVMRELSKAVRSRTLNVSHLLDTLADQYLKRELHGLGETLVVWNTGDQCAHCSGLHLTQVPASEAFALLHQCDNCQCYLTTMEGERIGL